MQGRVSVIIPVYNAGEYLPRCIESIIQQTYSNWEMILVDDGSTDESGRICDEYAREYHNIIVFHKKNGGVSSARNVGLRNANGEYICFVDGDDWISSYMLEYLMKSLNDDETDMSMCKIKLVDSYVEEEKTLYDRIKRRIQDRKQYLYENFLNHGNSCCAKLFKKDTLEQLDFQQGLTIGEDMLFLLKARERFNKVSVLDFPGYYYLQLPTSAMNKAFRPSFMDEIYCWQQALIEVKSDDEMNVDKMIVDKMKSIIIIAAYNVLSKIAYADIKDDNYRQICKRAIKDNIAGWRFLSIKERMQCLLALFSTRLYMKIYRLTV